MTDHIASPAPLLVQSPSRPWPWAAMLPWLLAAGIYLLLIAMAGRLLGDPDMYWHLVVGRWVAHNGMVPYSDSFSLTMSGQPWMAQEWLSDLLYAVAFAAGGWNAVAALAAAAIALAFGLLARALLQTLTPLATLILVLAAFVLASPHLVARPHVLAMPVMVAWAAALFGSLERGRALPIQALPLMTIWANLHGGFTFGLALIGVAGLEAIIAAPPAARWTAARRWVGFGLLATFMGCLTPYGPAALTTTVRILGLGDALSIIIEWRPQDFGTLTPFELCLLFGAGFAFYRGLKLPPARILGLLGLLYLALAHVRNAELLAFVGPLLLAAPLRRHFEMPVDDGPRRTAVAPAAIIVMILATATLFWTQQLAPAAQVTPKAAVEALRNAHAQRVFNDYEFGGYLIAAGVPPFIDGRTELYGGPFMVRQHQAITLENLPDFVKLLDDYKIDATLLAPSRPAVALLDRLPAWRRLYADDIAVVHVRKRP